MFLIKIEQKARYNTGAIQPPGLATKRLALIKTTKQSDGQQKNKTRNKLAPLGAIAFGEKRAHVDFENPGVISQRVGALPRH